MLHSVADDWLMPISASFVTAPSLLPAALAQIVVAVAQRSGHAVPAPLAGVVATERARAIAASLVEGARKAILLGNLAEQHPDASQLFALAQALAAMTGATLGCLMEAANSVGGYLAGALPQDGGLNAKAMVDAPRRAYLLLHAEPAFDCAHPVATRAALERAEFVAVLSPFRHGTEYADALLPIGPFSETAGTFVSCEGRVQQFHGVVPPLRDARPAWKVLRVLGTLCGLSGFEFETIEQVRATMALDASAVAARLANTTAVALATPATNGVSLERVADVPIHFADPLARRSPPLQQTADAAPPQARMNARTLQSAGAAPGEQVRIRQGRGEAVLAAKEDDGVPDGVVRIAAAHASTCALDGLSGPISVEKV